MDTRRYCLTCDLKDDPQLIEEYKTYHKPGNVWPEITQSIKAAGVEDMQIFLSAHRMFMIIEVNDSFSFEQKSRMDNENQKVREWEEIMWQFQQALPWAREGEKWILMEQIFQLDAGES